MKNWTIGKRVIGGYLILVTLSVILGFAVLDVMRMIEKNATEVRDDLVPGLSVASDLLQELSDGQFLLTRIVTATDPEQKHTCENKIHAIDKKNDATLQELERLCNTAEEKPFIEKMRRAKADYLAQRATILQLSDAGKNPEALENLIGPGNAAYEAYSGAADEFHEWQEKIAASTAEAIQQRTHHSDTFLIVALLADLALSLSLAWLVTRGINSVLRRVSTSLGQGAQQVAAAAGQVSSASQTLAEASGEQAASIEQTSASLEELSSTTSRNADHAQKANGLAKETRVAADKGSGDMQAMSSAMTAIKVSSDEIAKIIKTIDEIAFQTNILALNAAVEAARAGESGMGFAVVADEVRNLAQRSATAAKETAVKIENAITNTGQGVDLSQKVATTLNEIVVKARRVDELAAEVAGSTQEQAQGIKQINVAVSQMDKVTQANAASAEETAAASEELSALSQVMNQLAGELLHLVGGSAPDARQKNLKPNATHGMKNGSIAQDAIVPLAPRLPAKTTVHPAKIPAEAFKDF